MFLDDTPQRELSRSSVSWARSDTPQRELSHAPLSRERLFSYIKGEEELEAAMNRMPSPTTTEASSQFRIFCLGEGRSVFCLVGVGACSLFLLAFVVPLSVVIASTTRNYNATTTDNNTIIAVKSSSPTSVPNAAPSTVPSLSSTVVYDSTLPSLSPNLVSSIAPSVVVVSPTTTPSASSSTVLSTVPSEFPSVLSSNTPTIAPTSSPSALQSALPSLDSSAELSFVPTASPSSASSSKEPNAFPSTVPSVLPSISPTHVPTSSPGSLQSVPPSLDSSVSPNFVPTRSPSSLSLSKAPSVSSPVPSNVPIFLPSASPSTSPILAQSSLPSAYPSTVPSPNPSLAISASVWQRTAELNATVGIHHSGGRTPEPSFGRSVSMDKKGRRVAVGVPGPRRGYVRVYELSSNDDGQTTTSTVTLGATIMSDDRSHASSSSSSFGSLVQLSANGDRLAVRSLSHGVARISVYSYDPDWSWWFADRSFDLRSPKGRVVSRSTAAFSGEGRTLALSYVTVEDERSDGDGVSRIVVLHESKLHTFTLLSKIRNEEHHVSLSHDGNRIVYADREGVHVLEYRTNNCYWTRRCWDRVGEVLKGNAEEEEEEEGDSDFGSAVALSPDGHYLAVSSRRNTVVYASPSLSSSSTKHGPSLFEANQTWTRLGNAVAHHGDDVPTSVSLRSREIRPSPTITETVLTLAISEPGRSVVRVFEYNAKNAIWTSKGGSNDIVPPALGRTSDGFGDSISVTDDGLTVAVGVPFVPGDELNGSKNHKNNESNKGGKLFVYQLNTRQQADLDHRIHYSNM